MADIDEILTRGVANIIPNKEELKKKLESGKLNVYLGIDPTAPQIHLGHAVLLRKLQKFAELVHNVTFLIGDFTALIGDKSDKDSERPTLTPEEIEENFQTYKKQAEKILDFSKVKIRHNSEWLSELKFDEIIKLIQKFSLGDFISRELIKKRLGEGKRIGLHEAIYPIMQAYDSYHLKTDLQIGGTDQTFNMQSGRTLIKNLENRESFVLTTSILEGVDGRKMSKSYGNSIWLNDTPSDMYAKIMAIEDKLIINYFTLATDVSGEKIKEHEEKLKKDNRINIKKELASEIVKELHNEKSAQGAEENFKKTVQYKELPVELVTAENFQNTILDMVSDWATNNNRSEAKRLVQQGGVSVNGKKINLEESNENIEKEMTIKVGRKIIRIKPK